VVELKRMGSCARRAWERGVESQRSSAVSRPTVTTGHLLLGVLREDACAGGLILARLRLDLAWAGKVTEFVLLYGRRRGPEEASSEEWGGVPHTKAAKTVLDLCDEEANFFSPTYPIGTEHLLLAMLRVPDSTAYRLLHYFALDEDRVRAARDELWALLHSAE